MPKSRRKYGAVVIGVSTGGVDALKLLVTAMPKDFPLPVIVVSHIAPDSDNGLAELLDSMGRIRVREAEELMKPVKGTVYIAPANYHLQMERDATFSLSVDPPVSFARPSVDVLFETAAEALGAELIGVVLTGAGSDGSIGLKRIKEKNGLTIVQDPLDARMPSMPLSAIKATTVDHLVPLSGLTPLLVKLAAEGRSDRLKKGYKQTD